MSIANLQNLITQQFFILNLAKIFVFQAVTVGYIKSYQSKKKKSLKVVSNTLTIGLSRSLTYHTSHADINPLIAVTDLINSYALLPENISFVECF